MSSKKGSKGSYVVMLEQAKQPPKLAINVKPIPDTDLFQITIVHPNTRKALLTVTESFKDLNAAMARANALKDSEEVKQSPDYQDPWYEETLFIPNPKKGSMKLKTKESVEDELNEQLDAIEDDDEAYDFSSAYDEDEESKTKGSKSKAKVAKKLKKEKKVKVAKKINKTAKKPKKAPKKVVKKDKKAVSKKKKNKQSVGNR